MRFRRNKDIGILICPKCWRKTDLQGNPVENPYAREQKGLRKKERDWI